MVDLGITYVVEDINGHTPLLAAIVRPSPFNAVVKPLGYPAGFHALYQHVGGSQGWVFGNMIANIPGHPHFPYGYDVGPDH